MSITALLVIFAIAVFFVLAYMGRTYGAFVSAAVFLFWRWSEVGPENVNLYYTLLGLSAVLAVVLGVPALRRRAVSGPVMALARKVLPSMGETEKIALEAGTVWFDGELFSGNPNWNKLLGYKLQGLSKEEQEFLDGPTAKLCEMLDDWQINEDNDLSPEVWDFIKKNKFFGMIIPKEYGGLGFSALGHSEVITRIASRSVAAGVTVMVPNSLGPGELLAHYGTKAQKEHYLPRLAVGKEIPCFALTEPHAGSDAASMRSTGVVVKSKFGGKNITGIRLNFSKRYITLAPVATVLGVAFKLYDPDNLLGKGTDLGITCALIPRDTDGVTVGRRHDPVGVPFMNGPIEGKDVFIPLDYIIGGPEYVGQGWRMLMEQLSAGRGISLPSLSVSASQVSARAVGAYGNVREQFSIPIGKMEGIQEPAARIAAHAYFMNAMRRLTCGAVDAGEKPSVISAIAKAYMTEGMRGCLNDAMDIHGGAGICRGPKNIFAHSYQSIPIGITVEGANILTRSMIIFGQGAVRCHPHMQNMLKGLMENNPVVFDKAIFGLLNNLGRHAVRSLVFGLTGSFFITPPKGVGVYAGAFKQMTHFSANFALLTDLALLTLGGDLKRREHLSGRFADALSWLLICSAALKRYYDEGQSEHHRQLLDWTLAHGFKNIEDALYAITRNHPNRFAGILGHILAFPLGRFQHGPSDKQTDMVASKLFDPASHVRHDITQNIHIPSADKSGLGVLEAAYSAIIAAAPVRRKVEAGRRKGVIGKADVPTMAQKAHELSLITKEELALILDAEALRDRAVQVDSFDF